MQRSRLKNYEDYEDDGCDELATRDERAAMRFAEATRPITPHKDLQARKHLEKGIQGKVAYFEEQIQKQALNKLK